MQSGIKDRESGLRFAVVRCDVLSASGREKLPPACGGKEERGGMEKATGKKSLQPCPRSLKGFFDLSFHSLSACVVPCRHLFVSSLV